MLEKPIIVYFKGDNGIGKTTICKKLEQSISNSKHISLARPVKKIAMEFGYREIMKREGDKHRELLEKITELGTWFNERLWLDIFDKTVSYETTFHSNMIIFVNDMRYDYIEEEIKKEYTTLGYTLDINNREILYNIVMRDIENVVKESLKQTRFGGIVYANSKINY
jgi:nucleoside-triphosphatase THEP1